MVGSSVLDPGGGGAVEAGMPAAGASPADGAPVEVSSVCEGWIGAGGAVAGVLSPGALPDGAPVAGASGVGEVCGGAGGGVCAEALSLSAASTHNAKAHRRDATPAPRVARPPPKQSHGGSPSPSRLLNSIRGYDDVNRSSYTRSVGNNDAARHHNYR
jgi:hypothetical protein